MDDPTEIGDIENERMTPQGRRILLWCLVFGIVILAGGVFALFKWEELSSPPGDFPAQKLVVIPSGATLHEIATILEGEHIVRSKILFAGLVRYRGAESRIMAGEYLFSSPLDLFGVTDRLLGGVHGIERLRVTIPEGTSVMGIGRILKATFSDFDDTQFTTLTKGSEGYLFPDTYFFFSTATSGPIVETLKENFLEKTDVLRKEALARDQGWSDLIIMASIIEEETITPTDRRLVSGILWKRLAKHMHLQVDAPFAYAIGKNSATLTTFDLKNDSPYNTYRYGGLPPTPISNPGLDAIDAALHSEASPYFFYLSGKDGVVHYAKTFEEHKVNKERYLH